LCLGHLLMEYLLLGHLLMGHLLTFSIDAVVSVLPPLECPSRPCMRALILAFAATTAWTAPTAEMELVVACPGAAIVFLATTLLVPLSAELRLPLRFETDRLAAGWRESFFEAVRVMDDSLCISWCQLHSSAASRSLSE
jgi:hypothetical protein